MTSAAAPPPVEYQDMEYKDMESTPVDQLPEPESELASGVLRALDVLKDFAQPPHELRASDVAQKYHVSASTASRLFASLCKSDFCQRDEITGMYRLGLELVTLAGIVLNQSPIYREAHLVTQNLARVTELGANLAISRDQEIYYLATADGARSSRRVSLVGQRAPMHCTALGKVLLFDADPQFLASLPLTPRTIHTIVSVEELAADLARSRARGYAKEEQEMAMGRACIAAPITSSAGKVVASISVSGPASAHADPEGEQALVQRVIEAADSVSGVLM